MTLDANRTEHDLMAGMTDAQRLLFSSQMQMERKSPNVALILNLVLGGVGAHHFYLGRVVIGSIYLLFCWTFIPLFFSIFELFLIRKMAEEYNVDKAEKVAQLILSLPKVA